MRPPLSAACTDLAPLEAILARHAGSEGALLPVLQDVQRVFGFVPSAAVPRIAGALNLSRAEIHGVLDFYEELRTGPTGTNVCDLVVMAALPPRTSRRPRRL